MLVNVPYALKNSGVFSPLGVWLILQICLDVPQHVKTYLPFFSSLCSSVPSNI